MMSDDELRSELADLAGRTEIESVPLHDVQARGRRRALARRGGLVLAGFALVVGGTVAVTSIGGDDPLDVATEQADTTDTAAGDETNDSDDVESPAEPSLAEGPEDTDGVEEERASAEASSIAFDSGYAGGSQQIAEWGDGFLMFGERYVETEASELVFDGADPIGAYFSQEIIDAVAASGATTLEDAAAALEEAGLLEEATAIVTENPEVFEWFNANSGGGTTVPFADYSADGETWEPIEGFAWPTSSTWYAQISGNGTHLVVVDYQPTSDPETGQMRPAPITVHITTDLLTWTAVEVPYVFPAVADHIQLEAYPQQLVVTDDGWLLSVNQWQWIDIWLALPADVADEMRANGWDWMATEAGLEIVDWGWGGDAEETSAASESAAVTDEGIAIPEPDSLMEPEPTVVRVIPWSELPFTYEEYTGGDTSGGNRNQMFLGDLTSGEVVAAEGPGDAGDIGQIVATASGLFTTVWEYPDGALDLADHTVDGPAVQPTVTGFFSADGRSWQPRELPAMADDEWFGSVVALRDGVLLTTSGSSGGQRYFAGAADGTGFTEVDGPDLPADTPVWFSPSWGLGNGAASIVDLASRRTFFPAYDATFVQDDRSITFIQDDEGNRSITVIAADGEVVFEHRGHVTDEPPFEFGEEALSIVDDDGEAIVTIPHEVMEREVWQVESRAWEEYHEQNPYTPDFWLVATSDGRAWTTVQLPPPSDEAGWYSNPVMSGDRVLFSDGMGNWKVVSVG